MSLIDAITILVYEVIRFTGISQSVRGSRRGGGEDFMLLPNFPHSTKLREAHISSGIREVFAEELLKNTRYVYTLETNDISIPPRHPNSLFKSALYAEPTPRYLQS